MSLRPFHLAIPVTSLTSARHFYGDILKCEQGRSAPQWIDWNFYGHQLVTHKVDEMEKHLDANQVDQKSVPVPHFGLILEEANWHELAERLKQHKVKFEIEPYIRFAGKTGEQGTFFVFDPSYNALEFKYFKNLSQVFAV